MRKVLISSLRQVAKRVAGPQATAKYTAKRQVLQELAEGEPELSLLPLICDRNTSFLDVGANRGVYAFYAKEYCKHVYAVEAHPDLLRHLRLILDAKGTVLDVAASDWTGTAPFLIPVQDGRDIDTRCSLQADANAGFETREVEVRVSPIDALDLSDIGVIKIDVEGHEFDVLNGARRTIIARKPIVIIECEERHNAGGVDRVKGFFADLGYDGFFLHRGRLRPGGEFDVGELQSLSNAKTIGGARSPDYINNFIFIHPTNNSCLDRMRQRFH